MQSGPRQQRSPKEWFRKYFCHVEEDDNDNQSLLENLTPEEQFVERHRKLISFAIPVTTGLFLWLCTAYNYDYFSLYATHWQMPLTMVFGALIAGMTSEGGGAIAFPVMTFVLHMTPKDGRDFSITIQGFGMSSALFAIIFMRLNVEWRAIGLGVLGSIPGQLFGLYYVDPNFTAPEKKMLFVSIWSSFALSLWILNREKKRPTYSQIQNFCFWKAMVLLATGFVGGVFTAFAGSGVDICIFSVITLLFSVSEKNATPTTVVAMALSSQFCMYWRYVIMGDVSQIVVDYIKVSIPVGMGLAPFGAYVASFLHRQVLAHFVYILEAAAMFGFLLTGPPLHLMMTSSTILFCGFLFFSFLCKKGKDLLPPSEEPEKTALDVKCPL
uniref:Membrane transporter protein n=2 Tax=Bursaphelenchus xylophilus TaxID=6326 RepID=A0A1I7RPB0_BURXY